jgi:uncharacterized protein (DUF983 family)
MPDTAPIVVVPAVPVRWQPDRSVKLPPWPVPSMPEALLRGLRGACPACGKSHIFNGYLTVAKECTACHAPLGSIRADDIPPYITIFLVGHVVVAGMLILEQTVTPPLWVHTAIWVPLTLVLTLGLLRPIKGAVIGLMLKLGMVDAQPESLGGDA